MIVFINVTLGAVKNKHQNVSDLIVVYVMLN